MDGYDKAPPGILIADSEKFLQAEVKNPSADQFSKAMGFALYSNSKRNVDSFKPFFELLWNEPILNEEPKNCGPLYSRYSACLVFFILSRQ
jgi:hypothetical protein